MSWESTAISPEAYQSIIFSGDTDAAFIEKLAKERVSTWGQLVAVFHQYFPNQKQPTAITTRAALLKAAGTDSIKSQVELALKEKPAQEKVPSVTALEAMRKELEGLEDNQVKDLFEHDFHIAGHSVPSYMAMLRTIGARFAATNPSHHTAMRVLEAGLAIEGISLDGLNHIIS